jgi:hypothetical protein
MASTTATPVVIYVAGVCALHVTVIEFPSDNDTLFLHFPAMNAPVGLT